MKSIAFAQKALSHFSSVLEFLTCAFLQVFNVNTQLPSCRPVALPVLYVLHCSTKVKLTQPDSESGTKLAVPLLLIEKQVI